MSNPTETNNDAIVQMLDSLFIVANVPFAQTSELERRTFAAYGYGMLKAWTTDPAHPTTELRSLTEQMLQRVYKYADHQARDFSQMLEDVDRDRSQNAVFNDVIVHGNHAYRFWKSGDFPAIAQNLWDILKAVNQAYKQG